MQKTIFMNRNLGLYFFLAFMIIASVFSRARGQSSIEGHMQYWIFEKPGYHTFGFGASGRYELSENHMVYSGGSFALPVKGNIQLNMYSSNSYWPIKVNADAEINNWSVYGGLRRTRHMKNIDRFHFHYNYEIGYQWDKLLFTSIIPVDTSVHYGGSLPVTFKRRGVYLGYGFGFEIQVTDNGGIFLESKIDIPLRNEFTIDFFENSDYTTCFFHFVIRAGYRYRLEY